MALLCIKFNNKKDTPSALYDLVQPASAVHNYNTWYATNQNLCRPFSRTNYGPARFSVVASQTWEATPIKIKSDFLKNSNFGLTRYLIDLADFQHVVLEWCPKY